MFEAVAALAPTQARKVLCFEDKLPKRLTKPDFPDQLWDLSVRITGLDYFPRSELLI